MKTLAIETSCDDTSLSIISYYGDTFNVEQLLAYSQIADHQKYGGVLPEIASRLHSEKIIAILQRIGWETIADVDFISVTTHPGLPGSLVVGKAVAVMLAEYFNKPLVEVNHIHGHIFSILLERKLTDLTFPMVILTASGGHNDIYLVTPLPKGGSGEAAGGFVDGEKKSYKDIIRYDWALKELARDLRKNQTQAEKNLRYHFLSGYEYKFLRQKPIGGYIVDFVCNSLKLIIEVDGDSHFTDEAIVYDKERTKFLEWLGFYVMRFTNEEVFKSFGEVCERIKEYASSEKSSSFLQNPPYKIPPTKSPLQNPPYPPLWKGERNIQKLASTLDDASGEAFDKVSKMLGWPYPWWPRISQQAEQGKPNPDYQFKRIFLPANGENLYPFSFSWMKSQVSFLLERIKKEGKTLTEQDIADIAYEFQEATVETLAKRLLKAAKQHWAATVAVAGGVSANNRLIAYIQENIWNLPQWNLSIQFLYPAKKVYSTDNGAMIGVAGMLQKNC